jgi:radical SAM protein with 4Fe4S-binding SPASM domain
MVNTHAIQQPADKPLFKQSNRMLLGRLDIELTERCNNNCVHCCINLPANDLKALSRELTTEEIKAVLKEAASLGCLSVRFTGGEPLLREDFEELYVFARKQGLKVLLFTNATLVTSHLAKLFSRIPPLEKIEITLYGMKKSSYEAVSRIEGSYEAAWQGIKLLEKYKIPFIVKSALLPYNKKEIDIFKKWAGTISWMDQHPPAYSMFFGLRVNRDSLEKNKHINALRLSAKEGIAYLTRDKDAYIKEMKEFCSKFMRPPGDKIFSCGAGMGGGCVNAYGLFYPCLLLKSPETAYDLNNGSLKSALTEFFPKLRKTKAENKEYLKKCAACFLKGLCEQCPAKSWSEHGVLDKPVEYLCDIAHTQARFLGLIGENENAWEVKDWRERIEAFVNSK